jgi:hypothetical protein
MKTKMICALALFALASITRAVNPPPDGAYRNHNTAEGNDALFSLTTGLDNTALGFHALFNNTIGEDNTAVGYNALLHNRPTFNFNGFGNTAVGARVLESKLRGSELTIDTIVK